MNKSISAEIYIDHREPVSINALEQAVDRIRDASVNTALDLIRLNLPPNKRWTWWEKRNAKKKLLELCTDIFWIESVESGSSKINGLIARAVLSFVAAFTGKVAFDVVSETEVYQEHKAEAVAQLDEYWELFVHHLETSNHDNPENDIHLQVQVEGDRLRIYVRPSRRQSDSSLVI